MNTIKILTTRYRNKRVILCISMALLSLLLTLGVEFISLYTLNQQRIDGFTQQAVRKLEGILSPIASKRGELVQFLGQPCENIHLPVLKEVVSLQAVRVIALVKSGVVYCSSTFGDHNIPLKQISFPAHQPGLSLSVDQSLLAGPPVMLQWYPATTDGETGVIVVINIYLISALTLKPLKPWINRVAVVVGQQFYNVDSGIGTQFRQKEQEEIHSLFSKQFPFGIVVATPGASVLAQRELTSHFPLAVLIALLVAALTWITTARWLSFTREIRLGIARREFELWCQPQLDARTLQCNGVEILLRWNNPRLGWIAPDVFIPIAERNNLIIPLTRYVFTETVNNLNCFPSEPQFHISINVAANHFARGLLMQDVKRYWMSATPPQQLILELTERDSLQDGDFKVLQELYSHGVRLALDDFGTGSTSLQWLELLQPDILKIDKTFTQAIGTDTVSATVIDMIIALGHRLSINLIAEGVETELQADYLRLQNVMTLQGYLYARPMPLTAFQQWKESCCGES